MYRLKVVAGPNAGTVYPLSEGSYSIGRQADNSIVIDSEKVSKTHCVLVVNNQSLSIKDEGSTNGTFVNGVLSRSRILKKGDRVKVGNVVFLVFKETQDLALANAGQLPSTSDSFGAIESASQPQSPNLDINQVMLKQAAEPTNLRERVIHLFDNKLMPIFYGLNFKYEWKNIIAFLMAALVIGSVLLGLPGILEYSQSMIVREASKRAQFLAKEVAELNEPLLSQGQEDRLTVGSIEKQEGVLTAILVDLKGAKNRILAPSSKLNSIFSVGQEAVIAAKLSKKYNDGYDRGLVIPIGEDRIVAFEPVKVFARDRGKNISVAMAVVVLDISSSIISSADVMMQYSNSIIMTGILAILIYFIVVRLTLKPYQVLNEDIDRVLKGEMGQVTHEFRNEDLGSLWDVINTTLQRAQSSSGAGGASSQVISAEELVASAKGWIETLGNVGAIATDSERKIIWLNPLFEDASGIRGESALGQHISDVARDQAFVAFMGDLLDRSVVGQPAPTEEYEFSGIAFRVSAIALGAGPGTATANLICMTRKDDAS